MAWHLMVACVCACAVGPATREWTLRTADTEISVSVPDSPGRQPILRRLAAVGEDHNWAGPGMLVPLVGEVGVGGRVLPTQWRFEHAQQDPGAGRLVLLFRNADPKLELSSIWRARPGPGPVEHWIEIRNLSGGRVCVPHQDSLSLGGLRPGGDATLWWILRGGSNASSQGGTFNKPFQKGLDLTLLSNCEDGSSPVPWMAVQVGERRGLYVGWEFSGLGRIRARAVSSENPPADSLHLAIGNRPEFKTDVEPGETLWVPPALVGCYRGDLDEGSYRLHRFVIEKLRPPMPKDCPDPLLIINAYADVGMGRATEAEVLRCAKLTRELGFECVMNDAIWFPGTGDWRWDPLRFPRGADPIEKYVHTSGMRLGLWCAWTQGGLSTDRGALSVRGPVGRPEWFNSDYKPDWKPGPFWGAQMCLGCPAAKQWALAKTKALVAQQKLDYFKHDINPIATSCNKKTHRHHYGSDASYWAALGYYEVQESLLREFPHLVLENCSGGGHIKDFGVIQRSHYTVTTDTLSNLPDRQSLYDSTFALPPLVLQAYTYDNMYPVEGDNPGTFLWRSGMMSAWQPDPTDSIKWTEDERQSLAVSGQIYKQWIRPILADVKVHHILPRPDGKRWDGMFHWNARLQRGTLFMFRPDSQETTHTVRLKGLDGGRRYWLWCEDGSIEPGERAGETLMGKGLEIQLPGRYTSDIIYVQDAALGKPATLNPPGPFHARPAETKTDLVAAAVKLSWEPSANARGYRVFVAEGADFRNPVVQRTVCVPAISLDTLAPGRKYFWKVEAVSHGGKRESASGTMCFSVPERPKIPGLAFASDLNPVKTTVGADNPLRKDHNLYNKPIAIAGKVYPKGLWTHSFSDARPADVVFDVAGKGFAVFSADVGLDDASGGGSIAFQVLVDGQVKAASPVLTPRTMHSLRVDVRGAKEVTLRVLNGGDGYSCDHAAWGLARFLQAGVKDPFGD